MMLSLEASMSTKPGTEPAKSKAESWAEALSKESSKSAMRLNPTGRVFEAEKISSQQIIRHDCRVDCHCSKNVQSVRPGGSIEFFNAWPAIVKADKLTGCSWPFLINSHQSGTPWIGCSSARTSRCSKKRTKQWAAAKGRAAMWTLIRRQLLASSEIFLKRKLSAAQIASHVQLSASRVTISRRVGIDSDWSLWYYSGYKE